MNARVTKWTAILALALAAPLIQVRNARGADPVVPLSTTEPQPAESSVTLEYAEVNYPIVNWGLSVMQRPEPFIKEPHFDGGKLVRGTLNLRGEVPPVIGFAWDYSNGKLYVDLNRNGDLTDDPKGVFGCATVDRQSFYQSFSNVRLEVLTKTGSFPVLLDLNLHRMQGQLGASGGLRSCWQGKASLDGRDWQFGMVQGFDQEIGTLPGGYLVVRPWETRTEQVSLMDGAAEVFALPRQLFLGRHLYALNTKYEVQSGKGAFVMQFRQVPAKLGELEITGKYVRRVLLTCQGQTVLLDSPTGVVRVPVGSYTLNQIQVKRGPLVAVWETLGLLPFSHPAGLMVTIEESKRATLRAGAPLTNSVQLVQQGKHLALNYRLVGADGNSYRLLHQNQSRPPRFVITKAGKELAAGQFEFG